MVWLSILILISRLIADDVIFRVPDIFAGECVLIKISGQFDSGYFLRSTRENRIFYNGDHPGEQFRLRHLRMGRFPCITDDLFFCAIRCMCVFHQKTRC